MVTLLLIIIYIAFISLGLPDALLGAGWPAMHIDLGVPLSFAGILQILVSGGTILSSILSARLLARFGTGKVTAVSVGMTAIALLGFSFAPSFLWLIFATFPLGLGAGSVDTGLNAFVAENYESRHMSWLHSFWGVGALIGPLVLSFFLSKGISWRYGYRSIGLFQCFLVFILVISLPLWKKVRSQSKSKGNNVEHTVLSIPQMLRIKGVPFAVITFFAYCGIEASVGLWSGSYLVSVKGLAPARAAFWVSSFYASITIGRFITGFITFKIRNVDLIRWGGVVIGVGILFILLPLPFLFTIFGIMLIGLGCAPIFPCMLHETPGRFGARNAQSIMGLQMACAYVGTTFLPPLFGFISAVTSLKLLPMFLLIYVVILFVSSEKIRNLKVSL